MAFSIIKSNVFDTYLLRWMCRMWICVLSLCLFLMHGTVYHIIYKFAFAQNTHTYTHAKHIGHPIFFQTQILSHSHPQINLLTLVFIESFILMCWISHPRMHTSTQKRIRYTRTYLPASRDVNFYLESMWKCPLLLYLETLSISLMSKFKWWAEGQMHGQCMNDKGLLSTSIDQQIVQLMHTVVSFDAMYEYIFQIHLIYIAVDTFVCM